MCMLRRDAVTTPPVPRMRRETMKQYCYGLVTFCILVGLVDNAVADQKLPQIMGEWTETSTTICLPCTFTITRVADDGKLDLTFVSGNSPVEAWGQVTRNKGKLGVHITLADGTTLELESWKAGKSLMGTLYASVRGSGTIVSFYRPKKKK